jgi:hypothetical protein
MRTTFVRKALTVVELVLAVGTVAVLATLLVQSAAHLRQRDAQAVCLSNLHTIAMASFQYAAEDPREQIVPLHRMVVSTLAGLGWGGTEWSWRTAIPCSFGGRTATVPFPTNSGSVTVLMNPSGVWGARTRPLNRYLPGPGSSGLKTMHCPADTGYPDSPWVEETPLEAIGVPLFDMLGNSYRVGRLGAIWLQGSLRIAEFCVAPWGHTAPSMDGPLSEIALYCDALFWSFARWYYEPQADPIPGWHGQMLSDNVAYCDGSARLTERGELHEFTQEELDQMGYSAPFPWQACLRWGPSWRMDCYPTPGAMMVVYKPNGEPAYPNWHTLVDYPGWPFENYQWNPPP